MDNTLALMKGGGPTAPRHIIPKALLVLHTQPQGCIFKASRFRFLGHKPLKPDKSGLDKNSIFQDKVGPACCCFGSWAPGFGCLHCCTLTPALTP
jgi:hypothetical protein